MHGEIERLTATVPEDAFTDPQATDLRWRGVRVANLVLLFASLALMIYALFPGRFDGDSIAQYEFALRFYFDDALPIINTALMRELWFVMPGPGPMFLLQITLYVIGVGLITDALIKRGSRWVGLGLSVALLSPMLSFDYFDVQKDALLSALLAVLIGLGAQKLLNKSLVSPVAAIGAVFVFVLAVDARPNAVFAILPIWFIYRPVLGLRLRPIITTFLIACSAILVVVAGIKVTGYGFLKARRSHLEISLILFDLAGITARTNRDASEGALPQFQTAVARCYTPAQWDNFYLDPACSSLTTTARQAMQDPAARSRLQRVWVRQIATHPVAYAAHRVRNFQHLLRLGPYPPGFMNAAWAPRPWNEPDMRVTTLAHWWGGAAIWSWQGLGGRGWIWIAVLASAFVVCGVGLRRRSYEPFTYTGAAVSSAGLLYAASFAVFGVADQLRYMHPIIFLAMVATGFTAASFLRKNAGDGSTAKFVETAAEQTASLNAGRRSNSMLFVARGRLSLGGR